MNSICISLVHKVTVRTNLIAPIAISLKIPNNNPLKLTKIVHVLLLHVNCFFLWKISVQLVNIKW